MKKQPFNASGFKALQDELQQLTEVALQAEAQKISNDFADWIQSNFELKESQIRFLENLDRTFLKFTAEEVAFAVANKRPVTLAKSDPPANDDDQGKIIYTKSSLRASNGTKTGFAAGGELLIEISYS